MDETNSDGQYNYLFNIFVNNAQILHANEQQLRDALNIFDLIKSNIQNSISCFNEQLVVKAFKNSENVFPYFGLFNNEAIEYRKNDGFYIRGYDDYEQAIDYLLSAIEDYVKTPILYCEELNSIFLTFYLYLQNKKTSNLYGFKLMNPTCGWRYNLLGVFIGNLGGTLLAGYFTSGFVLYPLFIFILYKLHLTDVSEVGIFIFSVLLIYKIIRLIFDILYYKLGFKNKIQKKLLPFIDLQEYVFNNKVLQPSKIVELSNKVKDLPAVVSVLINNMRNQSDIANNNFINFFNLYKL